MASRLLPWVLAACAALACKRHGATVDAAVRPDPAPRLGTVQVQDMTADDALPAGARVDADALTAQVRERLRAAGIFTAGGPDAGAGPVARVRIELALEEVHVEKKAAMHAVVRVRIDARPSDAAQPHWNEDVQGASETTYPLEPTPDRKALAGKLASRTIGDLVDGYVARQRLWRGSATEVRRALETDAGELTIEAIRAVGERRLTDDVPALLKLLSDPEESVRDAALGALVELRERRAVSEIARQRSMRDKREMRKIIDAIATLGGDEAADYLSFVADTHDDEEIRQMAKRALERLKARGGAGGAAPSARP
jgi:hypothetical protein